MKPSRAFSGIWLGKWISLSYQEEKDLRLVNITMRRTTTAVAK